MRQALVRHPDSEGATVRVEASIARRSAQNLRLTYLVTGDIAELALPPLAPSARADHLWRNTCFEAFVGAGETYYEFNYAPSSAWAAYRFTGYRQGMTVATEASPPDISIQNERAALQLSANLKLDELTELSRKERWRLGLSAILMDSAGRTSWWALAHPTGRPDFHHPHCFAYKLSKEATS